MAAVDCPGEPLAEEEEEKEEDAAGSAAAATSSSSAISADRHAATDVER